MTVKEFRNKTTKALKSKKPLIVMGRIKKKLEKEGVKEEEVLEDFEEFRKDRRRR
jgi:hypothetical protein